MPVTVGTEKDLRPTSVSKPDIRFATTFISNKYRDYAVKGETLMDKATGEIFTKRPEDGRVVSFFQNKKYMSELMLDLRVMLNSNSEFRYPDSSNLDACYLSTDYDMMSLYNNQDISILENDNIVPNVEDKPVTQIKFKVSKKSNGFFCRMTSRDADKAIIEWLTNQYNAMFKNYDGDNEDFIEEKNKFIDNEKWQDSNATINYDLSISIGEDIKTFNLTDYIRINEQCCVLFPLSIDEYTYEDSTDITVTIKSITYDKIHFMYNHKDDFGTSFIDGMNKFIYPDNSIFIRYCNIYSFVDDSYDINLLGNEFIVALMDIPFVCRYMMKMSTLMSSSNIVMSPTRPTDDVWGPNGLWAEHIRDVYGSGKIEGTDHEIAIKELESYIADNSNINYVKISTELNDNDIYAHEEG